MKVAIIDDSSFMRRLIRNAFQEVHPDAEIVDFDDAAKALESLPGYAPDLITLDMLMPGLSGLDFLALLHTSTTLRPRIIVITADVQKTVRQKCLDFGVVDFIGKPITPEKLQFALGKLVTA